VPLLVADKGKIYSWSFCQPLLTYKRQKLKSLQRRARSTVHISHN